MLILIALAAWGGSQAALAADDASVATESHTVRAGETLWGIVSHHYAGSGQDIRSLIDRVMAANHLSDAALQPGQQLTLPAAPD